MRSIAEITAVVHRQLMTYDSLKMKQSAIMCPQYPLPFCHPSLGASIIGTTGTSSLCLLPEKEQQEQGQEEQQVGLGHHGILHACNEENIMK